jgi:glycerol kinase
VQAYLLAIDQGTTSSRAIIFNHLAEIISQHQIDLQQFYPQPGWVEQDPEEIWLHTLICCQQAITKANISAHEITAIGISNQRETTIIWDKDTGKPIYPAIVWQDRRTAEICATLSSHINLQNLSEKTGLLLDPYFSASKIVWILNHVAGARERAEQGKLAFGTVDTFLLWRLTQGKSHATDASNASRTLLFNIKTQCWDEELLTAFNIPSSLLPTVLDSAAHFGHTNKEWFGSAIPIQAILGDQQAATVGQACFQKGMLKSTYGTGCFVLLNTGSEIVHSKNKLLATVAYRLNGQVSYGLEGSIFAAGVGVKWLRDNLQIIKTAAETDTIAKSIPDTEGVYMVPAFTGLGAPYWDPYAKGALLGLNRNSGVAHIVRATLESVCYQTKDLLECMQQDVVINLHTLRVDGGMAANHWLMQFLADILNLTVEVPRYVETSALGVAFFAGLYAGVYPSLQDITQLWHAKHVFQVNMSHETRKKLYTGWQNAVKRVITDAAKVC